MNFTPASYDSLYPQLEQLGHKAWAEQLQKAVDAEFSSARHGKMPQWQEALRGLPEIEPSVIELTERVAIGSADQLDPADHADFIDKLKVLHPWRKGPF